MPCSSWCPGWNTWPVTPAPASDRGPAVPIERRGEIGGDRLRCASLDLVTVDEVHHLAVAQQRHRRAAGLVVGEVLPGARDRRQVLSREHRHDLLRADRMVQREAQGRTRVTRGAAADRVHEDQQGPLLIAQRGIYFSLVGELLGAHAGHLLAHRRDEGRIVRHVADSLLGYSVETVWPGASKAAFRVCHDRLAHFTRTGNSDTPENTASLPRVSASAGSSVPVTRRWKRPNSSSASWRVLPFTAVVMSDADALEMAHPEPWKLASWMTSSSSRTHTVS